MSKKSKLNEFEYPAEKLTKRKIAEKTADALRSADRLMQSRYPQPPAKPVYNNRFVFLSGLATGLLIGLWLAMFLLTYIPTVIK
jgi:predicted lipid-binding transport protein (Tim44 family)